MPGFGEACQNPTITGFPTSFASAADPCATISLWPVLTASDFQALDGSGLPRWKERVVHTFTDCDVKIILSNLWLQDVYRLWLDEVNAGQVATAELWLLARACLVIYDDDNVTTSAKSLYDPTFFENEKYIPGTMRDYFWRHCGPFSDSIKDPKTYKVKTRARRRLETGQTLWFQFEHGCGLINSKNYQTLSGAFGTLGPPLQGIGTFRTAYIE